nr:DNA translocase FtsK 4TM domain-containing protein [bacterium]
MTKKNSKKKKEIKFDNLKIDLDLSPDTSREIYAFIIGLLSLFSLLSMVGWLGPAGDITKTIFLLAIGLPAYLLPVIFAYFALHLILPAKINLQTRQTVSLILFLFILSSSFCLSFPHAPAAAGGYLGLWVNSIILGIIGRYGTVILYSFLLIISFLLFFNTSFSSLINQYQNLLRYFRFRSPKISRSTEKITINSYRDVIPVSHDENANPENETDLETKHSSDKP